MRNTALLRGVLAAVLVASPATLLKAQFSSDNLQIHGYLTQGYAKSSKIPYQGVPTQATEDYRVAALLFNYALTQQDRFVIQLQHRRLGVNLLATKEPDVSLNWAFYQRSYNYDQGSLSLKAGKLPMPRGIYNETRSVGTLLPFFRAPRNFYNEGYETLDGVSLSNTIGLPAGFSFDATAYYGGFSVNIVNQTPTGATFFSARNEPSSGFQTWLNTPIQGLRLGLGGQQWKVRPQSDTSHRTPNNAWYASVDGNFDRFTLQGEFGHWQLTPNGIYNRKFRYWGMTSVKLPYKFAVNGIWDIEDRTNRANPAQVYPKRHWRSSNDVGVGLNYNVSSNLVLKAEQHQVRGYDFDQYFPVAGPIQQSHYMIFSVASSF